MAVQGMGAFPCWWLLLPVQPQRGLPPHLHEVLNGSKVAGQRARRPRCGRCRSRLEGMPPLGPAVPAFPSGAGQPLLEPQSLHGTRLWMAMRPRLSGGTQGINLKGLEEI